MALKLHKCNICKKRFKASKTGRLQIVKKTKEGKKETWICRDCAPVIKEKLKEIGLKV
jgi:transcription initiation factor TFIIIB Brf1 subunit/transcription initiation factor TFIIB